MKTASLSVSTILLIFVLSGCAPKTGIISYADPSLALRIVATPTDDAELVQLASVQEGRLVKQDGRLIGEWVLIAKSSAATANVGRHLAVIADHEVRAAPIIRTPVRKQIVLSATKIDKVRVAATDN